MAFLDQIKESIIVGGVMLLQETAYMFLVILIKNKMVYIYVCSYNRVYSLFLIYRISY